MELREITLHGHRVCYREAGGPGPVVLLVHGIACDSAGWEHTGESLASKGFRVIAPDLPGHGGSDKPRTDYSLGAQATGLRDLLVALGEESATVVGHSLGGGISMQFAYQFPERCQRLVLVGSGGLGRDVALPLRAATLPGSELVLPLLTHPRVRGAAHQVGRRLSRLPIPQRPAVAEISRAFDALAASDARTAFIHTARGVMDMRGQRIDATEKLYLSEGRPIMFVHGAKDAIIPVRHAVRAHALVRGSRLEVLERSGHFPFLDEPERFVRVVTDFIASTDPAADDASELRLRLLAGGRTSS